MQDYSRNILALTVLLVMVLFVVGTILTSREIEPTVAGGLVAILGSIVALSATGKGEQ
jgi:ascorbate-specific PTS system EIIC-type component UlaA